MSPSAYTRGRGDAIFYTSQYLAHLERLGVRVINGSAAFRTEISKASQLTLFERSACRFRGAGDPSGAQAPAAEGLRFPVVVKPNIGGSGAGISGSTRSNGRARRTRDALHLGLDSTALVQEYIPADSGRIVRVEVLNGRYLYAIRIYTPATVSISARPTSARPWTAPSWPGRVPG